MKVNLDKATFNDLRSQADELELGWMFDWDEEYLYFNKWCYCYVAGTDRQASHRYAYTWADGKLTVDMDSKAPVIKETNYKVDEATPVEKELGSIKSMLNKLLNRSDVLKQFNDKTNEVIEPLYIPFGKVDGHLDAYLNEDGPIELVKSFNENVTTLQKAINHEHSTDCFDIGEAWVTEKETTLGGVSLPKLQPLVKLKYTDKAYELRKAGKLLGPSIGCSAWSQDVIKSLKDEMQVNPKRLLAEFDFSKKRHHLSLTTPAVGGPASGENWFIDLSKSKLSKEDLALIEELGEEFTELEKKQSVGNQEKAPSTSDSLEAGVDKETLNTGKDDDMSEITKAQLEELQKLRAEKAENEVSKSLDTYELDTEIQKGLAKVLVGLEDTAPVLKALDAMVAKVSEVEVSKAKEVKKDETELEKVFNQETGEAAEDKTPRSEMSSDELKKFRELDKQNS